MGWGEGEDSMGRISRVHLGHVKFEIPIKHGSDGTEKQNADSGVKLLYYFLAV